MTMSCEQLLQNVNALSRMHDDIFFLLLSFLSSEILRLELFMYSCVYSVIISLMLVWSFKGREMYGSALVYDVIKCCVYI